MSAKGGGIFGQPIRWLVLCSLSIVLILPIAKVQTSLALFHKESFFEFFLIAFKLSIFFDGEVCYLFLFPVPLHYSAPQGQGLKRPVYTTTLLSR